MKQDELVEIVADIVAAYLSNNPVQLGDLPGLIETVHGSVATLSTGSETVQANPLTPAVTVKSSVKKDHIVCLECGKKFKSLKRHIGANHHMTPERYRETWHLPSAYPMVAQDYSAVRSEMARTMGLGRKPKAALKGSRRKAR
jgi:predicted transcriptional regulator